MKAFVPAFSLLPGNTRLKSKTGRPVVRTVLGAFVLGAVSHVALTAATAPASAQALVQTPGEAPRAGFPNDPDTGPQHDPPVFVETSGSSQQLHPDLQNAIDNLNSAQSALNSFNSQFPNGEPVRSDYGSGQAGDDQYNQDLATYNSTLNTLEQDVKQASNQVKNEAQQHPPSTDTSGASCSQQLDSVTYGLGVAGFGTELAGDILEAVTSPGSIVGAEIAANVLSAVGVGIGLSGIIVEGVQNDLPNCEGVFTGTVETYANFISKMGLSTFDGAITLGYNELPTDPYDPNAVVPIQYYYEGITLGGGGLAGAGHGGEQAYTGDKDAIAVGNGARAENAGDTALGTHAWATGGNSTALGNFAFAEGMSSVAVGNEAHAKGDSSVAVGDKAEAGGDKDVAVGANTKTSGGSNNTAVGSDIEVTGTANTAVGTGHKLTGDHNTAIGDPIEIDGNANFVAGNDDTVQGNDNIVIGNGNDVGTVATPVDNNIVIGDNNDGITTNNNNVIGDSNTVGGGEGNSVFGDGITANGAQTVAIGQGANTGADNALAIGTMSSAAGASSVAVSSGSSAAGDAAIAVGLNADANGTAAIAIGGGAGGTQAQATNDFAIAIGNGAAASGAGATAFGGTTIALTTATGTNALAIQGASAAGEQSIAMGIGAMTTTGASNAAAFGSGSTASAVNASAYGQGSTASGMNSSAYGQGSTAEAMNSSAFGSGATVAASHTNSSAIGTGATTTYDNQMMFGTANQTYTMPGITSATSLSRQSGPLDVATTDAMGNMATDGGAIFTALSQLQAGVAMSFALENPELQGTESFGIAANWGSFKESQALGFAAIGVLSRDTFGGGERLAISGGIAVSVAERTYGGRTSDTQVGGRAGGQLTW